MTTPRSCARRGVTWSSRPTCSSRAATSAATGRRRATSAARRPPPTSRTSTRWVAPRTRSRSRLAAPPDLPVSWALDLADGIAEEAGSGRRLHRRRRPHHAPRRSSSRSRCSAPARWRPCSAAEPVRATCVALAGRQGWAAAGLAVLARGFRSPRALVEAYQRPQPPYAAGPAAAQAGATSMIDVSRRAARRHRSPRRATPEWPIDVDPAAFELAEPMQRGRLRAGRGPDAVHPGRRRRPRDRGDLPRGRRPAGGLHAGSASVSEPGDAGPVVTLGGAAYDGPQRLVALLRACKSEPPRSRRTWAVVRAGQTVSGRPCRP